MFNVSIENKREGVRYPEVSAVDGCVTFVADSILSVRSGMPFVVSYNEVLRYEGDSNRLLTAKDLEKETQSLKKKSLCIKHLIIRVLYEGSAGDTSDFKVSYRGYVFSLSIKDGKISVKLD